MGRGEQVTVERRVVVTGASSGIGTAFALHHARPGVSLVLVGRDMAALQSVVRQVRSLGATAEPVVADLSIPQGVDDACAAAGVVDVLVLNAGITMAGAVGTHDPDELDRMAYLMSAGVTRMCERLVPGMLERGNGNIVIVSSIAAFTPMKKSAPYAAAKSHATAYARSLALETSARGIRVVAVCPGYVRTDLHRRAGLQHLEKRVPGWMWLPPERVVEETERALHRGKTVVVPGRVYRAVLPFLSSAPAQRAWGALTRRNRRG